MSSGSLKDLSKAIVTSVPDLSLPLPESLINLIDAYLEKHDADDDANSQRLHDELLYIYENCIVEHPSLLAPFLGILQRLKEVLRGSGRLIQWWEKLSGPVLVHFGVEKGLAFETREILLGILVYDEDDGEAKQFEDTKATSRAVAANLLDIWLAKTTLADNEFDEYSKFVKEQIQMILISYGKKRPKDFLKTLNTFFVEKDTRIVTLSLLCEFFRHQPPHLHEMLSTPLWENLLHCLQIDTSTRAISLAITALIMFLPYIPSETSQHLPVLFNIYTRMLFWDRERKVGETQPAQAAGKHETSDSKEDWVKLSHLLDSENESVPELLHFFTFLYGLYPINFMSYVRKPQRYLRHANFPGADKLDELDIQPVEVSQRSEPFRQVHLLHPNFFVLTIESELIDSNRWLKSDAADVVTECMALYVPSHHAQQLATRPSRKGIELDLDIPDRPLLNDTSSCSLTTHISCRDNRSSAFISSDGQCASSFLHRPTFQTSHSIASIADSPSLYSSEQQESPTIPPRNTDISQNQVSEMPSSTKLVQGSMYKTLTNESVASLALSNYPECQDHAQSYNSYLRPDPVPCSPSLRTTNIEPTCSNLPIAYLLREIQLLKNDLNFERYLKQQHLSHIGRLRQKQISGARIEVETQNLINANKILKSKFEEAQRLNNQMKKESEKSKTHSRKWESELTAKLSLLRQEQRKWKIERDELLGDLKIATEDGKKMRQIIVEIESKELNAQQKVAFVQSNLEELERLREDVKAINLRIRVYEAGEKAAMDAKENETKALARVTILEAELQSRDQELIEAKYKFQEELKIYCKPQRLDDKLKEKEAKRESLIRDVIDEALNSSRSRMIELQKGYNKLQKRYAALQETNFELKGRLTALIEDATDDTLLSGYRSSGPGPTYCHPVKSRAKGIHHSPSDQELHPGMITSRSYTSPDDDRPWNVPQPFNSLFLHGGNTAVIRGTLGQVSLETERMDKEKNKPQNESRTLGVGGLHNVGKGKESEYARGKDVEAKKEKKLGFKGLRGLG